jgi:chemotaxis protein CheX
MTEQEIRVFINGASKYFKTVAASPAEIGTPFLKEPADRIISDFSAIIGITGVHRGCVYYTAPRSMVQKLVKELGETDISDDMCADFVGEIANTISGNAREHLGKNFLISVPVVLRGQPEAIRFPNDVATFVIPVLWDGHRSSLIVCLKDEEPLSMNGSVS